jgi:hypothetical protein
MAIVHEPTTTVNFDTALRSAANRARATQRPVHHPRIQRGLEIALAGGVDLLPDGTAMVQSQTRPGETYHVNGRCPCPDHDAPQAVCKHRWAKLLTKAALNVQKRTLGPDAYWATYTTPYGEEVPGTAEFDPHRQAWVFTPEDGQEPLYAALQALALGGHIATAQAQREADGDLGQKFGQPQYPAIHVDAVATAKAAVAARQAQRRTWGF